jgi:UDP-N-acetylmuramyl pentapeptide phosphotransferase/UDP-N-acetylglucosamine-1-phosphate transferase
LPFLVLIAAFLAAAALCALLLPSFRRAFLVIPAERSSHSKATPQGGGLVVIPVALVVAFAASLAAAGARPDAFAWGLTAALLALMLLGGWDDRTSLNQGFRLIVQAIAAGLALAAAPLDLTGAIANLPPVLVWTCLLIAMLWFINLTNFMDGLDWMSVSQFVPAFATVYWLLAGPANPAPWVGVLCLAAAGALIGFAVLNKPPARLFLGDSGSLPLGLLGAIAMLIVAGSRGAVVAVLPFLYYFADATLTLARRVFAGKKFWQAHREHFYQQATIRGLSTWQVIARVGACNVLLCALAVLIAGRPPAAQLAALIFGLALVALLMRSLVRERA